MQERGVSARIRSAKAGAAKRGEHARRIVSDQGVRPASGEPQGVQVIAYGPNVHPPTRGVLPPYQGRRGFPDRGVKGGGRHGKDRNNFV